MTSKMAAITEWGITDFLLWYTARKKYRHILFVMLFFCLCFGNCIHHFPDHLWLDLIIPLYHSSYFEKTLCPKDEEINVRVFWTDSITKNGVVGYGHRNITAGLRLVLQIYLLIQRPQLQMCLQVSCFVCLFVCLFLILYVPPTIFQL